MVGLCKVVRGCGGARPCNDFVETLFPIDLRHEAERIVDAPNIGDTVTDVAGAELAGNTWSEILDGVILAYQSVGV